MNKRVLIVGGVAGGASTAARVRRIDEFAEIIMFAYASLFLKRWSWRSLVAVCLILTGLRWVIVGLFPSIFFAHFFAL